MDYISLTKNVLLIPFNFLTSPSNRIFPLYLATSLAIAVFLHYMGRREEKKHKGPTQEIFPPQVYLHRSSIVDYFYFITNSILYVFLFAPFAGLMVYISHRVYAWLSNFGTPAVADSNQLWLIVAVYSLIMALVADFSLYIVHVYMHKSEVLWEFHKVHHSAEVMTPITVFRMHPLDDILTNVATIILSGLTDGLLRFFLLPEISPLAIYGISIFTFVFYLFGYNLRHSHIWFSYGQNLSKIFISPAQHQIHHSKARKHWNKNYGFIFAFWDYFGGSLYIPKERENIEFGIGNDEDKEFSSVLRLYFLPFKKAFRLVFPRKEKE